MPYYYNKMRWLCRAKRFFDLCKILVGFLKERKIIATFPQLQNPELAFLDDVTEHVNSLNLSLQGKDNLIIDMFQSVISSEPKLGPLFSEIQKGNLFNFSHLKCLGLLSEQFQNECVVTLCNLREKFQSSFHDFRKLEIDIALFSDPFSVNMSDVPAELKLNLIDLQLDRAFLKDKISV
ncbi:general transcription factor II-I repeat domain-containing protein 2A-like [Frankliniella occidentalis]|uniref:General transcription factor II-I repeat domain-containing protein 2A-like n=1 Tax=Frankliniella occidentalis TaxID=133901 RepID=A0A9C6X0H4_FRAOC|nr:general transcription factor II-I repeat domain-containing protein 2A-like [Frankliniella occidentalis]